ncbi:MAG: DUF296 domain-containing protein [Flavobacteriales bacterium]|nr:DUF296 domain-containing protein [Flavobacteriales bacterium]
MIQAMGRPGPMHAIRMVPGEDLRTGLQGWAERTGVRAGAVIAAVGSLGPCRLRFAGCSDATVLEQAQELLTLSGTIGPDGAHLHASVSGPDGTILGGHVLVGCVVRTTLELVILEIEGVALHRRPDPRTGFVELFPTGH